MQRLLLAGAAAVLGLLGAARAADLADRSFSPSGTVTLEFGGKGFDPAAFDVDLIVAFNPGPEETHGPGIGYFLDPDTGQTIREVPVSWRTASPASRRLKAYAFNTSFGLYLGVYLGQMAGEPVEVEFRSVTGRGTLREDTDAFTLRFKVKGIATLQGGGVRKFKGTVDLATP